MATENGGETMEKGCYLNYHYDNRSPIRWRIRTINTYSYCHQSYHHHPHYHHQRSMSMMGRLYLGLAENGRLGLFQGFSVFAHQPLEAGNVVVLAEKINFDHFKPRQYDQHDQNDFPMFPTAQYHHDKTLSFSRDLCLASLILTLVDVMIMMAMIMMLNL